MFLKKGPNPKNALFMAVSSENFRLCWLKQYRKRWSIERMFLSMKTHGFNLEQTHITFQKRIDKIVAIMSIAFAICCKVGMYHELKKQIPVKKHGRKLYSIFTYGLRWIKEWITRRFENLAESPLNQALMELS